MRPRDVPIIELRKPPGTSLAIHGRFHAIFRRMRPAIVHTRNLGGLDAQPAAAFAGVPVRIHGEHGWDTNDPDGARWRYVAIRKVHAPFVSRYIALSAHIERYLIERVGIDAGRVERICNGVDCARFAPSPSARRDLPREDFRDPGLVLVGTVGRLEPIKDQVTLARAFVLALERYPEARRYLRLVIVGSGSLQPAVEAILDAHDARSLAWLAGERTDVPALMAALDVFVLPSLAEGISNTILEAMACGVPTIATDVGGNAELVAPGETGELIPSGDASVLAEAIMRLAREGEERRRMSVAARRRALERFSLAEMVSRYAGVYDRELARRAPRMLAPQAGIRPTTD
jgi:sugar transferase (PEP-CTERM/EpsH1 system associated)